MMSVDEKTVLHHLSEWARRTPDKVALVDNGMRRTYRALAAMAAAQRAAFAAEGMGGPGVVALPAHDVTDFWAKALALRSLGLHSLAIPGPETLAELGGLELRCVIADPARHWPGLPAACAARGTPMVWRPAASLAASQGGDLPIVEPPGGHILLSSGTTGSQKLVLMEPSFEPALIAHRIRITEHAADSITGAFRYGVWTRAGYQAAVAAWTLGATVVYGQYALADTLLYPGLTHAIILPSMVTELIAAVPPGGPHLPTVRLISVGGPLTQAQARAIRERITPRLYNGIAATETNTFGDTLLANAEDVQWHRLVPDFDVQVVDDDDRIAPPGVVGHLRVSTKDGPTRYFNDEAATRERFRHGYFYTGDLAVIREDGRMALQGRTTDLLNVAGQKISPAPLEGRLREALGVNAVCLFSVPNALGEEEAHLVVESRAPLPADVLQPAINNELAGFATAYVHYAAVFPRNDMGKVIRAQLRAALATSRTEA